jgi:hypothetical protein
MGNLSFLGAYLVTALILPGFLVLAFAAILFPELRAPILKMSVAEQAAVVFVASFLTGHVPYFFEKHVFNRIWDCLYPSYRLVERSAILAERGGLVVRCDFSGLSRRHYDAALASFILYYNTSFWSVGLAIVAWARDSTLSLRLLGVGIGCISFVALFFTSPLYKKGVIDVLEVMKAELEKKNVTQTLDELVSGKEK